MTKIRIASLCFVVASLFTPLTAQAGVKPTLDARLEALEAKVAKLESGAVVEGDLIGTYAAVIFALDLKADPNVQTETARGTFTLKADHTADFSGQSANCFLRQLGTWSLGCDPDETGNFSASGTWSIDEDGSLVIQDEDGDDVINDPNFIGAGGRVIISGGSSTIPSSSAPTEIYSLTMILIKLPPSQLPQTP